MGILRPATPGFVVTLAATICLALVVFSENYVNSKWCLNELVKILNCKRDYDLVVIPIFFIGPTKVKNWARESKFEQALRDSAGEERDNKRKEWSNALTDASKIKGFHLQNDANGCVLVILAHVEAWYRNL